MTTDPKDTPPAASKVTQAAGGTWPILPGESNALYKKGLEATVKELGATTELQIFMAEKIFQCIWWMRRYETQKQSVILEGMVNKLTDFSTNADKRLEIRQLIFSQMWDDADVQKLVNKHGHTSASLLEEAMSSSKDELIKLDQQIGLRMKTLMQLQQSYEALVNRSIMQERLKLQNALLKRDLEAIDVTEVKQVNQNDKPKAKSGK
jgi:plasmid maintenance system antidote protein VapI